jgi:NADP-dependent 3-hydroxy acid dehydrogenase YdfG
MTDNERSKPNAPRFIMVTGASSGIGRAAAARLADAGHVVFGAARGGTRSMSSPPSTPKSVRSCST